MTSPTPLLCDTFYHLYNRGVNRENIFIEERNYTYFLHLYAKYIEPVAETFAYCLMRNHFHLLIRIKSVEELAADPAIAATLRVSKTLRIEDIPSKKFSDLFNTYAKSINAQFGRTGSLFQHPFGRQSVTRDAYFWRAIAYIHQNPQKHQFVSDFRDWNWSSYRAFLSEKPTRLQRQAVLEWFGGRQQYLELHALWVDEAQARWLAAEDG